MSLHLSLCSFRPLPLSFSVFAGDLGDLDFSNLGSSLIHKNSRTGLSHSGTEDMGRFNSSRVPWLHHLFFRMASRGASKEASRSSLWDLLWGLHRCSIWLQGGPPGAPKRRPKEPSQRSPPPNKKECEAIRRYPKQPDKEQTGSAKICNSSFVMPNDCPS